MTQGKTTHAVKWFRKAAEQEFAPAQFNLGVMYSEGRGGLPKSDIVAVEWYRKSAEQGYQNAQYSLGLMYAKGGNGVEKNLEKAMKWMRLAGGTTDGNSQD